ncbi:MAG: hypothetical protein PSX81_06020 [bacterium]|nr:hypothetical protein [bacterium]
MKQIKFILFSILFFNALYIVGQEQVLSAESASKIIKAINQSILNAKNFSAKLEYNIYKSHSDTNAFKTTTGYYRRNGSLEHSMLVGIETIQNETERLVIDTGSRSLMLSNPNPKVQMIDENMNVALTMCKKITKTTMNGISVLRFYPAEKTNTGFSMIEIKYSESHFFIQSLTLYYLNAVIPEFENIKNPKIEIVYTEVSTSRIAKSEFETAAFIERKNNKYNLTKSYNSFSFNNQIILNKNL